MLEPRIIAKINNVIIYFNWINKIQSKIINVINDDLPRYKVLLDDLRGYQFSFLSHRFEFVEKCCVIQHQLDQEEIKVRLGAKKTDIHILIYFHFISRQIIVKNFYYFLHYLSRLTAGSGPNISSAAEW